MRKLMMIVVASALAGEGLAPAAPVGFAMTPQQGASQQASQPLRFSKLMSGAPKPFARFRKSDAKPQLNLNAPHPKASYQAAAAKPTSPAIDPALSLATADKPTPEVLVAFANAAEAQENFEVAREKLKRAVGLAPTDATTLRAAGHFEDRRGELKVAEALYRRALASDPQAAAAVNDLAICLARQGRLEESAEAFTQAIQLRPEKALYRNNIAKVLVELDDEEGALGNLVAVHGPAVGHYNLGYMLQSSGKAEAAAKNFELALAADPTMEAARQALAMVAPTEPAVPQVAAAPAVAPATTPLPPAPVEPPVQVQGPVVTPAQVAVVPATPPAVPVAPQVAAPVYPATPAVAAPVFPRLLPPVVRQR